MRAFIQICGGLAIMLVSIYPIIIKGGAEEKFGPDLTALPYVPSECNHQAPQLEYHKIYTPKIENLRWTSPEIEVLRFEKISDATEHALVLRPNKILLGLILNEAGIEKDGTIDFFSKNPKSSASGLMQITTSTGRGFGLKIASENEISNVGSRMELINIDDRFHPILAIDAAARILACSTNYDPVPDPDTEGRYMMDPYKQAVWYYRGSPEHFPKYWKQLIKNIDGLTHRHREASRKKFNNRNPDLKVDGKYAGYTEYVEAMQKEMLNYDFERYEKMLSQN